MSWKLQAADPLGHLAGFIPIVCDLFSASHMRMWEMEADGEIIWSPDPGSAEVMTAVLCRRVSYDEGAKRQVSDSPPLNGQMTTPPGRRGRRRRSDGGEGGRRNGEGR